MKPIPISINEELRLLATELYRQFSPAQLEHLARNLGVIKRKRKIKAQDLISLCVYLGDEASSKSLTNLCSVLDAHFDVSLSTEGLNQRFTNALVNFIRTLFATLCNNKLSSAISLSKPYHYFSRIRILDATAFGLPAYYASSYPATNCTPDKAGMKIQLEYDLISGEYLLVDVESGKTSDCELGTLQAKTVEKNDLCLRDLGYFKIDDFIQMDQLGAYFISRIKPKTYVFTRNSGEVQYLLDGRVKKSSLYNPINLKQMMDSMKSGEVKEIPEVLIGREKKLKTRLILYKLTDEQLKKRQLIRSKKERTKTKSYSDETKQLDALHAFITNIPQDVVPKEDIYDLYSLRWQIEIVFNTWKSIFHIHKAKPMKEERFLCHLYGTLLAILLSSSLIFKMREILLRRKKLEISELKSMDIMKQYFSLIDSTLRSEGTEKIKEVLLKVSSMIEKNARKSHRYTKKTVFDILGVVYEHRHKESKIAA
ncbi:IS4 family transposase [Ammoniphilus sp. YIM 78166]|uniref:IS4 family transposase n=2 Tax=Ammoniphilus sp. YIM 78166 TaxID=1644106 RepID=UPI00106F28C1|nr:IS4 family transposase [Ammoniphilus sp. YIM 78166]